MPARLEDEGMVFKVYIGHDFSLNDFLIINVRLIAKWLLGATFQMIKNGFFQA